CMRSEPKHRWTEGKKRVTGRGDNSNGRIHQSFPNEEDKRARCAVHEQKPKMDCGDGLSEEKHRNRVCDVSSRKLHAISQFVRRNALQKKLTAISVFSFVAFERDSQKSNSDCDDQAKNG